MKKIGLVALVAMFAFVACGKKVKAVEEVAPETVVEEVVVVEPVADSTAVVEEVVEVVAE
jgi:hypothetical protein